MKTYILATNNAGKRKEFAALLKPYDIFITEKNEFDFSVDETGETFVENAILKARHATKLSGLPAIADDSGLCVDVINGKPGIKSARFAGTNAKDENNIEKLLQTLYMTPQNKRSASFHCVIVRMLHPDDPSPIICHGRWHGIIASDPQGENGFGYDPIFYIPSLQKTAAQLTIEEKDTISHRGQAIRLLLEQLQLEKAIEEAAS